MAQKQVLNSRDIVARKRNAGGSSNAADPPPLEVESATKLEPLGKSSPFEDHRMLENNDSHADDRDLAGEVAVGVPVPPTLHLYLTGVQHKNRLIRVLAMGIMFQALVLRSIAVFKRELVLLVITILLGSHLLNCSWVLLLGLVYSVLQLYCWVQAAMRVEYIRGHRAGAHGYNGEYCENTIEAMQALVAEDNGPHGPVGDLHYIEVDVQETADGELVVLHDFDIASAFANIGPNVDAYVQLHRQGVKLPPMSAFVQDLTSQQLRTLHIAGRPGLHAPTLAEFMAAFRAAGCKRPLIVEVKKLLSDRGRMLLLELLREHKPYADRLAREHPEYGNPHLGFLALIAFPHFYTACFGEFGTKQCAHWTKQYAAVGVPIRCCFLETLSYAHGL